MRCDVRFHASARCVGHQFLVFYVEFLGRGCLSAHLAYRNALKLNVRRQHRNVERDYSLWSAQCFLLGAVANHREDNRNAVLRVYRDGVMAAQVGRSAYEHGLFNAHGSQFDRVVILVGNDSRYLGFVL